MAQMSTYYKENDPKVAKWDIVIERERERD